MFRKLHFIFVTSAIYKLFFISADTAAPTPDTAVPCYYPTHMQCWTDWFDRDDPSGVGDFETLVDLRAENPGKICPSPVEIEVTTLNGDLTATGNMFDVVDTITGFVCHNLHQPPKTTCQDYRVRFSCYPPFCGNVCWTNWFDRDDPSGTGDWELLIDLRKQYPKVCATPLYIEAVTVDTNTPAIATGQHFLHYNPTVGFVCRNDDPGNGACRDYKVRFGCPCGC